MTERTRLCLTVPLGSSVRIGDCDVEIASIVSKPGFNQRRYREALLRNSTGKELWFVENMEAYFETYSLLVTEITTTKVRMAIHADKSVPIARAGVELQNAD